MTYTDLNSMVKWEANLSNLRQGVRQGGVLSTSHYKRYNNPLLKEVENRFPVALIGHIEIPHVTPTYDIAFLIHAEMEMQCMLDCGQFRRKEQIWYPSTKSYVLTYPNGHMGMEKVTYIMGGYQVQQASQIKHLGISRETSLKVNIEE